MTVTGIEISELARIATGFAIGSKSVLFPSPFVNQIVLSVEFHLYYSQ